MYGGMGGMGGFGGYGGLGGMPVDPNDPNSFARGMESSTAATFQMIESIVGAFGGFAQMLESTYMATHSSFFGAYMRALVYRVMSPASADIYWDDSNGSSRRAIWQPSEHPRVNTRYFYNDAVGAHCSSKGDWPSTASVTRRVDRKQFCRL